MTISPNEAPPRTGVLVLVDRKYAPGDTVLEGLEKDAREAKKGLWVDPASIPPWVYRKATQ
jgi:endonuclease YncB( thermonuclease family)